MPGGIQVEFDIQDGNVVKNLQTLQRNTGPDLEKFMRDDLVQYIQNRAQGRFANEGDDAVGQWAPLKPATEVRRASKGFSPAHPINVRTGDLRSYITNDSGTVSGGADEWTLTWPDPPPSGELQEKTETAQRGKAYPSTVARPVIGLGASDISRITDDLGRFIQGGLL